MQKLKFLSFAPFLMTIQAVSSDYDYFLDTNALDQQIAEYFYEDAGKDSISASANKSDNMQKEMAPCQKYNSHNYVERAQKTSDRSYHQGDKILPQTKSPVFDATIYCARFFSWAYIPESGKIVVSNFDSLLKCIQYACGSTYQTSNPEYRLKALKRSFDISPDISTGLIVMISKNPENFLERFIFVGPYAPFWLWPSNYQTGPLY